MKMDLVPNFPYKFLSGDWEDLISESCCIQFSDLLNMALQRADSEEFRVECLGVLGNLTIPELDFERMLSEYDLIPWMKDRIAEATNGRLAGGLGELDDLILEIVV